MRFAIHKYNAHGQNVFVADVDVCKWWFTNVKSLKMLLNFINLNYFSAFFGNDCFSVQQSQDKNCNYYYI